MFSKQRYHLSRFAVVFAQQIWTFAWFQKLYSLITVCDIKAHRRRRTTNALYIRCTSKTRTCC